MAMVSANAAPFGARGELQLSVSNAGTLAKISIIGEFYEGWTNSDFRYQMDQARAAGAKDVEVYINSIGGHVTCGNDVVNVIKEFIAETGGKVTGKGGAIVASIATVVALACETFTMASNGNFMIHQPRAGTPSRGATADELESMAKAVRNMGEQIAEAYSKKTGLTVEVVKALYATADYWMTAKQAVEQKFIDGIHDSEPITKETKAMFEACGRNVEITTVAPTQPSNSLISNNMTLREQALKMGLTPAAGATDEAIQAMIDTELTALRNDRASLASMRLQTQNDAAANKTAAITAALDRFIQEKRIHADARAFVKTRLEAATDVVAEIAKVDEEMPPVISFNAGIKPDANGGAGAPVAGRTGWDIEKWMNEDPRGLQALHKNNYEAYNALYMAKYSADAPQAR